MVQVTRRPGSNVRVLTNDIVQALQPNGRVSRRPVHRFQVESRPWEIQPFFIAPVLPGETMDNMLLQERSVSQPIKNPLIGAWREHYIFYVKLTDLDDSDILTDMLIDDSATLTGATFLHATASEMAYKQGISTYDYVQACLRRVVLEYFRDEDEGLTFGAGAFSGAGTLSGYPLATVHAQASWMDSLMLDDVEATPEPMEGNTDSRGDDNYLEQWLRMRQMGMTDLTYEDYLAAHGVRGEETEEVARPELVRYSREWVYPSNTVDPTTGVPSSAWSWSIAERADKKRFFKEPGFLFGVAVTRPKVYFSKQKGALAQHLTNAFHWLPQMMKDNPETSLAKFAAAAGPLAGNTGALDYWVDFRDLFLYGDQFVNFALTETDNGLVALPGAALTKAAQRYAAVTDIENLFTSVAASGTRDGRLIRADGTVSLAIRGRQRDLT